MGEILNIDIVLFSIVLDTATFLAYYIVYAVMIVVALGATSHIVDGVVVLRALSFEAVIAHAKHFACESVRHDRLARLPCHLCHDSCA